MPIINVGAAPRLTLSSMIIKLVRQLLTVSVDVGKSTQALVDPCNTPCGLARRLRNIAPPDVTNTDAWPTQHEIRSSGQPFFGYASAPLDLLGNVMPSFGAFAGDVGDHAGAVWGDVVDEVAPSFGIDCVRVQ